MRRRDVDGSRDGERDGVVEAEEDRPTMRVDVYRMVISFIGAGRIHAYEKRRAHCTLIALGTSILVNVVIITARVAGGGSLISHVLDFNRAAI